jgi:hypothetical protein
MVGTVLEELVDQITVGGMNLNAVEAGFSRAVRGAGKVVHCVVDIFFCHGYWRDIRLLA